MSENNCTFSIFRQYPGTGGIQGTGDVELTKKL